MKHRALFALTVALVTTCHMAHAQSDLLKNLRWRSIGPAIMGGRIDDFAVVESNPKIVYVATASSGVWKTVNKGVTWEPVFDNQPTSSIGDVTVAPSNPDIVWVGTGEANNRQSSSWGNGVYRSTDAGKTWTHMGLDNTHHIGRIAIHPQNPDVVYVAAAGRLWGPSPERGVYKTTDGGKTWTLSLFVDQDTGCTDIAMDPQEPDTVYAAMYQRRRTAFGFHGGGPGSGIHRTTDGGKTWTKLTNGLPTAEKGRIGLSVYRKDPKIVYAIVEAVGGGVFRSEDRGETWKRMSATNPRPMYYSQIAVDPSNDQNVWVLGVPIYVSSDGGRTFRQTGTPSVHSDFHAIWIDPADSNHVLTGCDGGIQWSYDRGRTWDYQNTIPLAQFYEITFDYRKPYWVYGGLQDNGSWGAPSQTLTMQGPSNDEWVRVGGGDGFYAQADPVDPNTIYVESQNGAINRRNVATGEAKSIRPRPPAGEPAYRFDWNAPIIISPHNNRRIYFGGNRLFISDDRGDSWRRTEDLTTSPVRREMKIMGRTPSRAIPSLDDGQSTFGQIVTVSESPAKAGILFVGTDDGNLQVSVDDGRTWKNVIANVPGVPRGTYVSRVQASSHAPGRCYAAFDGHRSDDFKPYIFVTEDYGVSWQPVANGIPEGSTVSVVREHPRNANLLFAGTERGAYVSFDRGQKWERMPEPLPMVPVDDIQIHPRENDLILGTHGRGIYILDDITPLEQIAEAASAGNLALFPPRTAIAWRLTNHKGNNGDEFFVGQNPPNGALIQYLLKSKPARREDVKITILEKDGKTVVRDITLNATPDAGLNRVVWDLRYNPPVGPAALRTQAGAGPGGARGPRPGAAQPAAQPRPPAETRAEEDRPPQTPAAPAGQPGGQPQQRQFGGGFGGGFARGPRVLPGTYLVRIKVGEEEQTRPLRVEEDPRLPITASQRRTHFSAVMRLYNLAKTQDEARRALAGIRTQVNAVKSAESFKTATQETKDAVAAAEKRLAELQARLIPQPGRRGAAQIESATSSPSEAPSERPDEPEPPEQVQPIALRITLLTASVEGITEPPSRALLEQISEVAADLRKLVGEINAFSQKELAALRKQAGSTVATTAPPISRIALPR